MGYRNSRLRVQDLVNTIKALPTKKRPTIVDIIMETNCSVRPNHPNWEKIREIEAIAWPVYTVQATCEGNKPKITTTFPIISSTQETFDKQKEINIMHTYSKTTIYNPVLHKKKLGTPNN